jgi:hypothetical protein
MVNKIRKNTATNQTIKTGACVLDKILVGKGGDLCTLTVYDDTTVLYTAILNDEFLRKGAEVPKPYIIPFDIPITTSLKVQLHVPAAVLHYKLNDYATSTSTTATDSGSLASNGTLTNFTATPWGTTSRIGSSCLDFDGTDDWIDCGANSAALDPDSGLSVSFWIYCSNAELQNGSIVYCYDGTKGFNVATLATGDRLRFFLKGTGANYIMVSHGTNLTEDAWHHVVVVYDGNATTSIDCVKIYIDRTLQTLETNSTGLIVGTAVTATNVKIGHGDWYFDGRLDDVRVYEEALTSEEVSLLYNQGIGTEEDFNVADITIVYKT